MESGKHKDFLNQNQAWRKGKLSPNDSCTLKIWIPGNHCLVFFLPPSPPLLYSLPCNPQQQRKAPESCTECPPPTWVGMDNFSISSPGHMLTGVIKLVSYVVEDGKPAHCCIFLLKWDSKQALSVDFSIPSSPFLFFWSLVTRPEVSITVWHLDERLPVHKHLKLDLRFGQYYHKYYLQNIVKWSFWAFWVWEWSIYFNSNFITIKKMKNKLKN